MFSQVDLSAGLVRFVMFDKDTSRLDSVVVCSTQELLKSEDNIGRFDSILRVWCALTPALGLKAPGSQDLASYFPSAARVRVRIILSQHRFVKCTTVDFVRLPAPLPHLIRSALRNGGRVGC